MSKSFSVVIGSIALTISLSCIAAASDPVCNSIQKMIAKQKQTFAHYMDVNYYARADVKEAKVHISADRKLITADQAKIAKLTQELATQKEHMAHVQASLAKHEHAVEVTSKHLEPVPQAVLDNERQLIAILSDKYRGMCLMRNPDDPAQTPLAMQFYP